MRLRFSGESRLDAQGYFDALVSNAVLERIKNANKAFTELFRVTSSGGVGLHQVDYRDHRDFARPLEHLLLDPNRSHERCGQG